MDRKKMVFTMVFTVVTFIALCLAGFAEDKVVAKEKSKIKIACIASITGPMGAKIKHMTNGVQLAVKEINAKGGILGGRKVELLMYDPRGVPEEAVTATRRAIYDDKVKAIVGLEDASLALAAKPVIMKARIPFVNTMAAHANLVQKPGEVGFMSSACPQIQAVRTQMKFAEEILGIRSVVALGPDTAWLWGNFESIRKNWDQPNSKVKVFDLIPYPVGTPDITVPIMKAVNYTPDLIWSFAWGITDTIQVYKKLAEVGYKGKIQQCWGMLIPPVLEGAGKAAEGSWGMTIWGPELRNPESVALRDAMIKEFGANTEMSDVTEWGYTGTMVLLMAMNKAGTDTDVVAIDKAWHKIDWITPRGYKWELDETGWSVWRELSIVQVRNGKVEVVAKIPK